MPSESRTQMLPMHACRCVPPSPAHADQEIDSRISLQVTLETYILQFHCWMKTTGINGSPKYLMVWLPGFFWANFVLVSFVYVFLSFRIFHITAALRDVVIPKEGGAALAKRAVVIAIGMPIFYAAGGLLKQFCAPTLE